MEEEEKYELGLWIGGKVEFNLGDPSFIINASLCKFFEGDDKVRSFHSHEAWDGVEMEERHYLSQRGPGDWTVDHYYRLFYTGYRPEIPEMERGLKSMKTIQRGTDKLYKEEGPAMDFAHYLQRVSKTLKIKKWVWKISQAGFPFSGSDSEFHISDVVSGMYHVRRLPMDNAQWQKLLKEKDVKLAA
jgi:hypothetical protein